MPALLPLICTAVLAKIFGPYMISAAGKDYASTDLASDASAEYEGAQKIAGIYLAPQLNTPIAIYNAIKNDYIRIIYADGQIADFKIKRWPSTMPVEFSRKMPAANSAHLDPTSDLMLMKASCLPANQTTTITVRTGYWGSDAYLDTNGNWNITGGWVDTGSMTFSIPLPAFMNFACK